MKRVWKLWSRQKVDTLDEESSIPLVSEGGSIHGELIRAMACVAPGTPIARIRQPSQIYFQVLNSVLDELPERLLDVVRTPSLTDVSPSGTRQRLYTILTAITDILAAESSHVFMKQLCTLLGDRNLIRRQEDNQASFESSSGTVPTSNSWDVETAQLLFILVGALTLLYIPVPNPEPGRAQMRTNSSTFNSRRRHVATWQSGSQDVSSFGDDIALEDLLCRYAHALKGPIPMPRTQQQSTQQQQQQQRSSPESNTLRSENVSFYTLANLLNVQILWTTSVCEHLEFNHRTKQLKMFRLPSYCVMLCLLEPEKTYLDSLFGRLLEEEDTPRVSSLDFFREVLSTYRLIFGQHADARKLITKICARGRFLGFKSPFYSPHPSALVKKNPDPLLEELCFTDSRNVALFSDLDMLDLKNIYTLDADFPYFAERLSILNTFVHNQLPNGWKVLWRDRRDVAKFWTIWAVLLFGAPSLILAMIQAFLAGWALRPSEEASTPATPTEV
ncbi:hypothetical protein B0T25DRAFT_550422 [Lasiosphaeria hispida]|uniref:Uncharacterized protein n=1 Tax=Lasiosphaeria hispida TaxID=260671 RepID=A0AAJ0MA67_9PEZI|nr:hypothetical protein B0T25DRAFT_550422 [Lasiosphaeria hispida]